MTCTSQRGAASRPSPYGRQYRYTLSCFHVKNIKAHGLDVETVHGAVGKTPSYDGTQIELPAPTAR